jgi:hypothetical protein
MLWQAGMALNRHVQSRPAGNGKMVTGLKFEARRQPAPFLL